MRECMGRGDIGNTFEYAIDSMNSTKGIEIKQATFFVWEVVARWRQSDKTHGRRKTIAFWPR